jgi:hypothetical protein
MWCVYYSPGPGTGRPLHVLFPFLRAGTWRCLPSPVDLGQIPALQEPKVGLLDLHR